MIYGRNKFLEKIESANINGYVYGIIREDCKDGEKIKKIKIGSTMCYKKRWFNYQTTDNEPWEYIFVYKLHSEKCYEKCYNVDNIIQKLFNDKRYKIDFGGKEWYSGDIIEDVKHYLDDIGKELSKDTIDYKNFKRYPNHDKIIRKFDNNEWDNKSKYNTTFKVLSKWFNKLKKNKKQKFKLRDYQKIIKKIIIKKMPKNKAIYLKAPTGSGKTVIMWSIINELIPDIVIFFSHRRVINKQNGNKKYLEILDNNYEILDFSHDKIKYCNKLKSSKKIVITACIQSSNKLYSIIKDFEDFEDKNILVCFDESHDTVESWVHKINENNYDNNKEKQNINFWLKDNKINNRIFCSATPNTNLIIENNDIFGSYINKITIQELINKEYLCNFKAFCFDTKPKELIDLTRFILDSFKKYEKNKGICYHNNIKSAVDSFLIHFKLYKNRETDIKPYIIVSYSKYTNKLKDIPNEFKNEDSFEEENNCICYNVGMLTTGYDVPDIDYLFFSDKVESTRKLLQCIGRGLRSDNKGLDGKNKDKELIFGFFNYYNEKEEPYKIIEVIRDISLELEVLFNFNYIISSNNSSNTIRTNKTKYGSEIMDSKLIDITKYKLSKESTEKLMEKIKYYNKNKINNEEYDNLIINTKNLEKNKIFNDFKKPIICEIKNYYIDRYVFKEDLKILKKTFINNKEDFIDELKKRGIYKKFDSSIGYDYITKKYSKCVKNFKNNDNRLPPLSLLNAGFIDINIIEHLKRDKIHKNNREKHIDI